MLIEKKMINKETYIEKFDRKFANFCEKNILSLYYTIYPEYIEIVDDGGGNKGCHKGDKGCHEPSSHNGEHTGNPVYRTFPAPGLV